VRLRIDIGNQHRPSSRQPLASHMQHLKALSSSGLWRPQTISVGHAVVVLAVAARPRHTSEGGRDDRGVPSRGPVPCGIDPIQCSSAQGPSPRLVHCVLAPGNAVYETVAAVAVAALGLSPGVEVSRPGVEGVELLSRDRGVEACRSLSRPVKACRGLSRLRPCLPVSRGVEGCRVLISRPVGARPPPLSEGGGS